MHIVRLADEYAAATGLAPCTVSKRAAGQAYAIDRLRRGHDITIGRAARIIQWFSDHWIENVPWPADIPRPQPATEAQTIENDNQINELEADKEPSVSAPPGTLLVPTRDTISHTLTLRGHDISAWARRHGYEPKAVHKAISRWGGRILDPARCRSAHVLVIVEHLVCETDRDREEAAFEDAIGTLSNYSAIAPQRGNKITLQDLTRLKRAERQHERKRSH